MFSALGNALCAECLKNICYIMKQSVILSNLRFFAYHGVMEQENKVGHYFTVSIEIICDFSKAIASDKVKDTINYGKVFEVVKNEMEQPSKLMEHLAGRIIIALFRNFVLAQQVKLKIIKENPPINADCDGCGISVDLNRNECELIS